MKNIFVFIMLLCFSLNSSGFLDGNIRFRLTGDWCYSTATFWDNHAFECDSYLPDNAVELRYKNMLFSEVKLLDKYLNALKKITVVSSKKKDCSFEALPVLLDAFEVSSTSYVSNIDKVIVYLDPTVVSKVHAKYAHLEDEEERNILNGRTVSELLSYYDRNVKELDDSVDCKRIESNNNENKLVKIENYSFSKQEWECQYSYDVDFNFEMELNFDSGFFNKVVYKSSDFSIDIKGKKTVDLPRYNQAIDLKIDRTFFSKYRDNGNINDYCYDSRGRPIEGWQESLNLDVQNKYRDLIKDLDRRTLKKSRMNYFDISDVIEVY